MSNENITTTERCQHNTTTVKLYVPETAAGEQLYGKALLETLKLRAAEAFGGYTTYDARGGWENEDGELIEENVTVLEVITHRSDDTDAEAFAKANARWIFDATDESEVMAEIDDTMLTIS